MGNKIAIPIQVKARLNVEVSVGHYFPYPIDGKERWLGAMLSIPQGGFRRNLQDLKFRMDTIKPIKKGDFHRKNVKVDTLASIKEWGKKWELNY